MPARPAWPSAFAARGPPSRSARRSDTFRAVLLALTSGQKLGLGLVAGVFIAFALASAFAIPRWRPDFPGARGLKLFVAVTVVLVVAMLTAIAVLAQEEEEGEARGGEAAAETRAAETETGAETQATETETGGEPQAAGDPEAGAEVFASAGCGGCHILQEAGSGGAIGPNLDESQPGYDLVVERVTNGRGVMPSFRGELSEQEIQNVAAYVVRATGS
jgi:cytochrome c6